MEADYYEEIMIGGLMRYRTEKGGDYRAFTEIELSKKYNDLKVEFMEYKYNNETK